jgi:hypothetical protein
LGAEYHAWFRLATVAPVNVVVLADLDCVERQKRREVCIYIVDVSALCLTTSDIRLVGDDNQ